MMSRMRSSVIANVVLATVPALIAVGALGSSGCKKKENKPAEEKPETASGSAEEGDEPAEVPRTGEGETGKSLAPRNDFVKITPEEIEPLVPQLTGGQRVGEVKSIAGGRRMNVIVCVNGIDPADVKKELEQRFGDLGITSIMKDERLRRHQRKNWFSLRGEKNGVRVSANMRAAEYPDCKASEKKTRVALTYYKARAPRGQPPGAKAPAAGQQPPAGGAAPAPAAPGGAQQPQGQQPPAETKPPAGADAGSSG
jgi:hypothetical protein